MRTALEQIMLFTGATDFLQLKDTAIQAIIFWHPSCMRIFVQQSGGADV
jgi:hypothetical protein